MLQASEFLEPARELGFDFWAGVPCSYLTPFINYVIDDDGLTYVSSANEGDAVATASGATLGGRRGVVIMQNSGLGNAVSPLSSLNWVFRIPVLLIVTLRGDPGHGDEPQHELMGRVTGELLDTLDIRWRWFPTGAEGVQAALAEATAYMDRSGRPFAFVMRKGSVAPHALRTPPPQPASYWSEAPRALADAEAPSRVEVLRVIVEATPPENSVVFATTGYTGRELYAIEDRPNQLYVVGSMGCASSLALGFSMAQPELRVVVVDGDGAVLMRMGNLATIGAYAGSGFSQVVLDNGMHESTGGQATVSPGVNIAALAAACGYSQCVRAGTPEDVRRALQAAQGPSLAHIRIAPGTPDELPRPAVTPVGVRRRLMRHLGLDAPWLAAE